MKHVKTELSDNLEERELLATRLTGLQSLTSEIIHLLHAQTFSTQGVKTVKNICEDFCNLLLRHFDRGSAAIYFYDDNDHLETTFKSSLESVEESAALKASGLLLGHVLENGTEQLFWLDEDSRRVPDLAQLLESAGKLSAIGLPISSAEKVSGVLVVMATGSALAENLSTIRFITAPIMIAIGNVERVQALQEQRNHIEQLVQELQERGLALEDANRELRRVALYRSLFLARLSHELRTPLTSILGFAEILLDHEKLSEAQRRFCEKIRSSGFQLETSLKHLIALSRIEADQTDLFLHEFSLIDAMRDSCMALSGRAQKNNVQIDFDAQADLPTILSDEAKLRQVFYNFIAFAIDRTPGGGSVNIRVTHRDEWFKIGITDSGEPLKDQEMILEPTDVPVPGRLGTNLSELGVAIGRRLVEMLSGKLLLAGSASGLTVTIDLPLKTQQKPSLQQSQFSAELPS
jgi:signal transduction histidine kinase